MPLLHRIWDATFLHPVHSQHLVVTPVGPSSSSDDHALTLTRGGSRVCRSRSDAARTRADAEVVLGGEWQGHPDAVERTFIEDADDSGDITFLGYTNDMPDKFRRSSLFIYLAHYRKGVPQVLLEASASARAVVTADVPGCRDAVRQGETRLIVPPRDVTQLVEAMEYLLGNPQERERMGNNGRSLVERHFSLAAITEQQLDIYDHIGGFAASRHNQP